MFEDVDANASTFVDIHVVNSTNEIRQWIQGNAVGKSTHRVRKVILGAEKLARRRDGGKDGTREGKSKG